MEMQYTLVFNAWHTVTDAEGRTLETLFSAVGTNHDQVRGALVSHLLHYFYNGESQGYGHEFPYHVSQGIAELDAFDLLESDITDFEEWHEVPSGPGVTSWMFAVTEAYTPEPIQHYFTSSSLECAPSTKTPQRGPAPSPVAPGAF